MAHVLIVDDESDFASGIAEFLRMQSHTVAVANSLSAARRLVAKRAPEFVLLDLMLPDGSGLELLSELTDPRPSHVIIVTGHPGVKSLIGEMAGENISYMKKPIEPRELVSLLNSMQSREIDAEDASHRRRFGLMVGESEAMRDVYATIRKVADTDSTVFIQGESGTGKELVADAIHRLSHRPGPFVPVNCGSLTKELLSSELFGHEKGAFTGAARRHAGFFEQANNGTLFLDEITEMSGDMQTHLLRVLETGKVLRVGAESEISVNARLIAATNRDPAAAVKEGILREDLYFRLSVFPIVLPALHERREDIPLLADFFLDELNSKHDSNKRFSERSLELFERHSWPGNVRELKHAVHRCYIMADSDVIEVPRNLFDDLPVKVEGLRPGRSIADVEKDLILATLEHFEGNRKAAAASLGVSVKTLYNRLKSYECEN
ncbi:MAG TPA: sigma-54 dependent transcriptional regulator [Woeseiaceae bacterium]|nr:sigma-54 dependent transcriptional regulator [Woeseiaceae bacterium]